MATDIIVVGRPTPQTSDMSFTYERVSRQEYQKAYDGGAPDSSGNPVSTIRVNVKLSSAANEEKALIAAENVAKALEKILAAAKIVDSNSPNTKIIMADGSQKSAKDIISLLQTNSWVVTDNSFQGINCGRGGADAKNHIDYLDFRAFDGDLNNSSGDYAAPYYGGISGVAGVMMHELAHLTSEGALVSQESTVYFNRYNREEGGNGLQWIGSEFWYDNERFAANSAKSINDVLNVGAAEYFNIDSYDDNRYIGARALYLSLKNESSTNGVSSGGRELNGSYQTESDPFIIFDMIFKSDNISSTNDLDMIDKINKGLIIYHDPVPDPFHDYSIDSYF